MSVRRATAVEGRSSAEGERSSQRLAVSDPPPLSALAPVVRHPMGASAVQFIRLRLSPADRVAAARLIANEDSRMLRPENDNGTAGALTMDAYGILQTIHDVAHEQGWSHSRALHALGPHVAGNRVPTRRRHQVYRSLPAFGIDRPALWLDSDGPWGVYGKNWERLRAGVAEVIAIGFPAPSAVPILAWGNDEDATIAESRGLIRVELPGGTDNGFYGRAAAVIAASTARGERR